MNYIWILCYTLYSNYVVLNSLEVPNYNSLVLEIKKNALVHFSSFVKIAKEENLMIYMKTQ
jgi:hypothetical protein